MVNSNKRLMVYDTAGDLFWNTPTEKGDAKIFDLIDYSAADAVIIHIERLKNSEVVGKIIKSARSFGIPVIAIDGECDGCVNLKFDYAAGFKKVVEHVIHKHCVHRLHFIAGIKGNEFSELRLKVFKETLEENGIPFDDSMVSYGDFWSVPTRSAVTRLIKEKRVPEAIICANDVMAITAASVLTQNGISVPDDVIVTGFDGIDEINFSVPRITSCLCSQERIAEKAAEVIDDFYEGKQILREYFIEPTLIESESCGCIPETIINAADYLNKLNDRFFRYREETLSLGDLSSRIQVCDGIYEVCEVLHSKKSLYDMACVLKDEVIDETKDSLKIYTESSFGENLHIVYNTSAARSDEVRSIGVKELLPNMEGFLQDRKFPLIFNALASVDIPLGYVCFFYNDCDISNYMKINQIISVLSSGFIGFRNMRYQKYLTRQIEDMYKYDSLTGLYNRLGFSKEFPRLKERNRGGLITAVLADLDRLKYINDTFGHDEGDVAIKAIADALKNACKGDAICTRFGGDEMFAVIGGKADGDAVKESIRTYLDDLNKALNKPYTISASVGIYTAQSDNMGFEELIRKSDELMYIEKFLKKASDTLKQ